MRGVWAALAGLFLGACVSELPEPSYTTALGVRVFLFGQSLEPALVDRSVELTLAEFSSRFDVEKARRAVEGALVSFLPVEDYELNGSRVAGNVSGDGQWLYVAIKDKTLPQSALVHEWVHYFDLQLKGDTDGTHASWASDIFPGIARVNAQLAAALPKATSP